MSRIARRARWIVAAGFAARAACYTSCVKAVWPIVVALAGACSDPGTDGAKVFGAVCATCHGPTGKPNEMMVAKLGVKDLTSPALRKTLTAERVADQVRNGSQNHAMPAFATALSSAQIEAVAKYVASEQFVK